MTAPTPTLTARLGRVTPAWWLLVGWAGLVVLHLWIARGVPGPIVLQDETGYLGNARWLIGQSPVPEMGDVPVYAWGYSLVISPLVALIDDPGTLYRAVQVANSMMAAALIPLLWRVLRDIAALDVRPALLASLAGSVFPATLVHSSIAWSESLLAPLVVVLTLATWWTLTERSRWQRLVVAPVAVLLYAAHPRFLPALVLVTLGLALAAAVRRIPALVGIGGTAICVAGWLVVRVVDSALVDARWPDRVPDEGSVSRLLARLVDPSNLPGIASGSVGEAWYLAVGSLGLAASGTIAVVWWMAHTDGRRSGWRDLAATPQGLVSAWLTVVIVSLFVTSVVSFVGTAERVDHLIYGRYNEAFAPLLVAIGAAALLITSGRRRLQLVIATGAVIVALGGVLMVGRSADAFDGPVVWNNILGVRAVVELFDLRWVVPAATVATLLALGVLVATVRRPALGVTGLVVALAVSGAVAVRPLADFAASRYDGWVLPDHLERVVAVAESDGLLLDRNGTGLMAVHGYPYWSPRLRFTIGDVPDIGGSFPSDLVVSSLEPTGALAADGRIVALDARNGQAVWVVPGPTGAFEALTARGATLPQGFPDMALPVAARVARLAIDGQPTPIEIDSGSSIAVRLTVAHAGANHPWPSDAEWPLPGVVRVTSRWYDARAGDEGRIVRSGERVHLPYPLWPGDQTTVSLVLHASSSDGTPLAPGTYRVGVTMVQEGFGAFDDEFDEPLVIDVVVT